MTMRCLSQSCTFICSGTEKLFPKNTCLVVASGTICLTPKIRVQKLAVLAFGAGISVLQSRKINRSLVVNNSNHLVHCTCHVVSYIYNTPTYTHTQNLGPFPSSALDSKVWRQNKKTLLRPHSRPIALPWIGER